MQLSSSGSSRNVIVRRKLILVAEDDPAIGEMLTRILRHDYDVVHVADGLSALTRANSKPFPDLMLLDIMMPEMDGIAVALRARLNPELKRTPIIFLTAKSSPMDVVRGIQAGARSYITKPFKLEEVLDKVKKALAT